MTAELPSKDDVARRGDLMSKALAEAARRARFSTRSRRGFDSGGFGARRGARALRLLALASFALFVVLPTLAGAIYYAFFASDQYYSETQFTVMGGQISSKSNDALGAATGLPVAAIIQDTQIVTNFLQSRGGVEAIEARVGLRKMYGAPTVDWFSRFPADDSVEDLVNYWGWMSKASIKMPAGIVTFSARAYTPQDARAIVDAVVEISEKLINDLNSRMQKDAVASAESELKRASERLGEARAKMEQARNEEGVLDATRAGEELGKLLTELKASSLSMTQEYDALRRTINESSPQMRAMRARIDASRAQIVDVERKLTAAREGSDRSISASMSRFAALDLDRQIAEKLYTGAAATLELARLAADSRLMYLRTFVMPSTPQEPLYPKRILNVVLIFAGSLASWAALSGLAILARNSMA